MNSETKPPLPVAVFAHNEARNILACLESLDNATKQPLECYVLANACSDATETIVREYAKTHPHVHLVSITLGDKANAWNVFIHDTAPREHACYFFIDGDMRATPGAIDAMLNTLARHPHANGVAALPKSGRGVAAFQKDMLENNGVAGNLYGLRGSFVKRIQAQQIRMPVGTIGEDALIGAMLKWDLRGDTRWDNERIAVAKKAGFKFDSISPWRFSEWRKYFRRRVRYSVRGYQNKMLGRAIQPNGFAALPVHIDGLYHRHAQLLQAHGLGLNSFFDRLAIREIKAVLSHK